jgi:DNA-binding response OmpR family regulator
MLGVLLIVEGDETICTSMTELLAVKGYACLSATSGSEGLRLLESEKPLLVILDFHLPDMNGGEFLLKKAAIPFVAAIPVVMVTAYRSVPIPHGAVAVAQLYKPLGIEELLTEIKKHVGPTVEPEPEAA